LRFHTGMRQEDLLGESCSHPSEESSSILQGLSNLFELLFMLSVLR
jgi:hypothetical protein